MPSWGNSGQEEPGPDTRELPHLPMSLLSQTGNSREKSAFIPRKSLLFCVSVRTAGLPVRTDTRLCGQTDQPQGLKGAQRPGTGWEVPSAPHPELSLWEGPTPPLT